MLGARGSGYGDVTVADAEADVVDSREPKGRATRSTIKDNQLLNLGHSSGSQTATFTVFIRFDFSVPIDTAGDDVPMSPAAYTHVEPREMGIINLYTARLPRPSPLKHLHECTLRVRGLASMSGVVTDGCWHWHMSSCRSSHAPDLLMTD